MWDVTLRRVVIPYRRFGTTVGSIFTGQSVLGHCVTSQKSSVLIYMAAEARNHAYLWLFLGKWPTWCTIIFYILISILYMFRATPCSSSGESVVSTEHLVYVTLCRWPFRVQVGPTYTQYDLVRKPSTFDALIGYFTPSHVIQKRLLLQFLSAPEDGRKKRPKHVEYYCSYW